MLGEGKSIFFNEVAPDKLTIHYVTSRNPKTRWATQAPQSQRMGWIIDPFLKYTDSEKRNEKNNFKVEKLDKCVLRQWPRPMSSVIKMVTPVCSYLMINVSHRLGHLNTQLPVVALFGEAYISEKICLVSYGSIMAHLQFKVLGGRDRGSLGLGD